MLSDNSLSNMKIQSTTNNHLSIIINHLTMSSTTVESPLQISSFLTNKANFPKSQMNINKEMAKEYEKKDTWWSGKNKANSKPNKANLQKTKMNVNKVLTKAYEKMSNWAICENKANFNPKQTQTKPISPPGCLVFRCGPAGFFRSGTILSGVRG